MSTRSTSTGTIKVLIVDDHAMLREGLKVFLSRQPGFEVCGEASSGPEAMQQLLRIKPDFITVDISLKNGDGIELVKQVHAMDDQIKMLVLSMHDESLYAERAIRAGAMGYLSKDQARDCLIEAFHTILDGHIYLSPEMTARMLARQMGKQDIGRSPIETLSDRELQVFESIGNGLSIREIAMKLMLSPKTIETYRENIKFKLNVDHVNDLIRHAVKWVLQEA